MSVVRTESEIADVENEAVARTEEGSRYPGMSYEEGVVAALRWVQDKDADNPLED